MKLPCPPVLCLLWLLSACAPDAGSGSGEGPLEALRDLARWSGSPWHMRLQPDLGTAAFLEGRTHPVASAERAASSARAFLLHVHRLFGLMPNEELEQAYHRVDSLGMRHVRFVQARKGVPIWSSALTVHLDPQGAIVRVSGRSLPIGPLPPEALHPRIAGEAARQLALSWVRAERPAVSLTATVPVLWLWPRQDGTALAWRVEVEGQEGARPLRQEVFVDAHSGTLLSQTDLVARISLSVPASGSGTGVLGERRLLSITQRGPSFYLEDAQRGRQRTTLVRLGERLPGRTVTSRDPDTWPDPAAVDVHAHLASIWDYFAKVHGHFGWDGAGRGVVAVARSGDRQAIGLFDGRRIVLGDGSEHDLLPPGAALDVVAHEYTHAVVAALAGLRVDGESGAVGEGVADLFACLIEQHAEPLRGDWTVGERIKPGAPLRDLRDPLRSHQLRSLGWAPAAVAGPESVRAHAGIVGHAGYLLASRIGALRAAAIWYRAISTYLHQFAGFSDVVDATLAAAKDLHGRDESVLRAVREAWNAVGVGGMETIGKSAYP
ncbi:MAG: M4 family metallopeptidase [Myxococcales bacterium]|nr:M4 family metallopeptidase [Myxococcota bacterium]MDW8281463.1 M4 family metallopeptidase [Myxococcales bacterium]